MKPEYEFFDPLSSAAHAWRPAPGDRTGQLEEMVLAADAETGDFTRLLRFGPGADTSPNGTLTHDVWEEVWILSGSIEDLRLGTTFGPGQYACRPPGMEHGPWRAAPEGAMTFEIRYARRTGSGE
jgi:hypothetical protein